MILNTGLEVSDKDTNGLYNSQLQGLQQLSDWYHSTELEATLKGFAGTGKTFLISYFIKNVIDKTYTVTAPTHKALSVLEKQIGVNGITLQSLHGLKPNTELADYDINNLKFDTIGIPKMQHYSIILVDESSMVNKAVRKLTLDRAKQYNIKILWIG